MMKRMILGIAGCLVVASAAGATNLLDRFSLRLGPGAVMAAGGHYNDTEKLNKVVSPGMGLTATFRYKASDSLFIDAGYAFDWMAVKYSKRPVALKESGPALNLQMLTVNGTLFLASGYAVEPFLTMGVGICPWRFSSRPILGTPWPAPANPEDTFSATDPVFNVGLGVEVYLFRKVSAFAEFKYHYVFARHVARFGTDDFTQQDFLGLSVGLVYEFGKE
jgi:opacity protein-like surface antigen